MTVDGERDSSDEEMEQTSSGASAAEEAARMRKKRLLEMKSRIHGVPMAEEDYKEEEQATKKARSEDKAFRSYQPVDQSIAKTDPIAKPNLRAVEEEIAEQLRLAADTTAVNQIDIATLAPKKVDWDLKRDLAKKLEKLDRRTQAAMAELIRERLSHGEHDLAAAVASVN